MAAGLGGPLEEAAATAQWLGLLLSAAGAAFAAWFLFAHGVHYWRGSAGLGVCCYGIAQYWLAQRWRKDSADAKRVRT
jgi:hypothetical protein